METKNLFAKMIAYNFSDLKFVEERNSNCFAAIANIVGFCDCENPINLPGCDEKCHCDTCECDTCDKN